MKTIKIWLLRGAEGIGAAMLAALFLTFILQIFSRYVLNESFGWTLEVCTTLWLWLVFWGNAFVVRHDRHITFDLIYHSVSRRTKRVFALLGAAAIVIGLTISLYPTWDYISFLQIRKSAVLYLPMDYVFSIYLVFIISAIIAYTWRFIRIIRNGVPEEKPALNIKEDVT
jgi:TRAP-type C4-dicarboxylate transport system permease small subunit